MRKFDFAIIFLIILLTSCNKEEISFPAGFNAPVIHGYMARDDFGNSVKLIGSDDRKTFDPGLKSMEINIVSYPNPCSEYFTLHVGGAAISKKIWIIPGNGSDVLTSLINSNCIVVQGQPIYGIETTSEDLRIDLNNFLYNYYRVYVKVNDVLLWDNIVKQ